MIENRTNIILAIPPYQIENERDFIWLGLLVGIGKQVLPWKTCKLLSPLTKIRLFLKSVKVLDVFDVKFDDLEAGLDEVEKFITDQEDTKN